MKITFRPQKYALVLTFFLITVFAGSAVSQVTEEWVRRHNSLGGILDISYDMILDNFGNVYVTGRSGIYGVPRSYCTIKYNSNGVQKWVNYYYHPINSWNVAVSIGIDDFCNAYVTGYSIGYQTGYDWCTVKYDSSGIEKWAERYTSPPPLTFDEAVALTVDKDGNICVTGKSQETTGSDYCTIKYNSLGDTLWTRIYTNTPYYSRPSSIATDPSGNIYVTGYTKDYNHLWNMCTVKYFPDGTQHWVQIYDGPAGRFDYAADITVDDSGNVYITGYSFGYSFGMGTLDMCTIKYNTNGIQQWLSRYDPPDTASAEATAIAIDNEGSIYITGYSYTSGHGHRDYCTIKYNSDGVEQWVSSYNGPGNGYDQANSIAVDDDGNVYVTGSSAGLNTDEDYATLKYNSAGSLEWLIRYNGPGDSTDVANTIALDSSGNVFITGTSIGDTTRQDYCTIKYSQSTSLRRIKSVIPTEISLFQNYPNPFNPSTSIRFDLNKSSHVKLIIYNILGKEITTLINEKISAGSYEVDWKGSGYPSGVYFYKLIADDFVDAKKMILIK